MKTWHVMTGVVFASIPLAGIAQGAGLMQGDPSALIAHADTNHDGKISRDEFLAARSAQFDRLDRNHDGYVDASDTSSLPERAQRVVRMMMQSADGNGDGRISREEFNAMPAPMFDRMDTDHDGQLDADEVAAARKRGAQRIDRAGD
jgi:Ca2+-binding EF-hand superfamily protein